MASCKVLLGLLRIIDDSELDTQEDILLNSLKSEEYQDIIHLIEKYANRVLIDDEGKCDWDMHKVLRENGFDVYPGERDRFGWLTGCIQTRKGYILFG